MGAYTDNMVETPPGEGMRRALLLVICGLAVAVAVAFSPAAGLWHPQSGNARIVSVQP
jgi:hypothetical protein